MASLLERVLNNVPLIEDGDPNTARIPVHDILALLGLYQHDTSLGLTPAQWRDEIAQRLDLSPSQGVALVGFTLALDFGKDLDLVESTLIAGNAARLDDNTQRMLTPAQVALILGL